MESEIAYSFSLTTFSKTGQLRQISHALHAVQRGRTSIGIKAINGVVIAADKKVESILVDPTSVQLVTPITKNIGSTYSGLTADYRCLLDSVRKEAEEYKNEFGESQPIQTAVKSIAGVMQDYTQKGGVRPFGCSILVAGLDTMSEEARKQPHGYVGALYQVDPLGSYFSWKAAANGRNSENARIFIEKRYEDGMDIEDAIQVALLTLRETVEGELTPERCEIGVIGGVFGKEFRKLSLQEVKRFLQQIE